MSGSLALIGLVGAVLWLLYTDHPIVNLRLLKNRNFGVGCGMMGLMALMMYASSVMIPQMAQLVLGYNATWAGLVLSPGAVAMIMFIPFVGKLMGMVQVRYLVAFGFVMLSTSMFAAHGWPPNVDFKTLVEVRVVQTVGLAFLFVPISTLAYLTLPREQSPDAAAIYTMFRNVAGSIGISIVTALVSNQQQAHMSHMVQHLTQLDPGYMAELSRIVAGLARVGQPASAAAGYFYRQLQIQSVMMGYNDVYLWCSVAAMAVVPLCWLFSPGKSQGGRIEH
jgi:DHA2 family multidrug resistance protein